MSLFPSLTYLREAMNTAKAGRFELLCAKWFGRHFSTEVEGIRYGFIDYRGKVYFVSQRPVPEANKPCPVNCSKAGMCLSNDYECPCSDADRVGTPEERIARAVGIGCAITFVVLAIGFAVIGATQ